MPENENRDEETTSADKRSPTQGDGDVHEDGAVHPDGTVHPESTIHPESTVRQESKAHVESNVHEDNNAQEDSPRSESAELIQEGWRRVQAAFDSGASFVRESLNKLPFLASVEVEVQNSGEPHDETHYFLIPYHLSESGYTLYSTRRLPEGYAVANSLPKRRVFHLPGPGGEKTLESLILAQHLHRLQRDETADESAAEEESDDWGERLTTIADEIDRHSQRVTGGVILIGGLVALANPIVGVGIAAKALLPSVGGLLTREGLKTVGSKLTDWRKNREAKRKAQQIEEEVRKHEKAAKSSTVHSVTNPILATLESALGTNESEFDPTLEFDFGSFDSVYPEQYEPQELIDMSIRAVVATYEEQLSARKVDPKSGLGEEDLRWLRLLRELASDS